MDFKKEQMKKLHEGLGSCPEAQDAIKGAFPECFEEEWVNITSELVAKVSMMTKKQGYIKLYHDGAFVAYTESHHEFSGLRLTCSHLNYKIETEGGDFVVFKKS